MVAFNTGKRMTRAQSCRSLIAVTMAAEAVVVEVAVGTVAPARHQRHLPPAAAAGRVVAAAAETGVAATHGKLPQRLLRNRIGKAGVAIGTALNLPHQRPLPPFRNDAGAAMMALAVVVITAAAAPMPWLLLLAAVASMTATVMAGRIGNGIATATAP